MLASVNRLRRYGPLAAAALVVLLVDIAAVTTLPRGVFLTPDEGGKYLEMHSLRWTDAGLEYELPYGGRDLDPEHRFYPGVAPHTFPYPVATSDGAILFHWPIWFPLLSLPFYALFGVLGIQVLPLVCGLAIAVISGLMVERLRAGLGPVTVLVVGLATPIFFYSISFWEHTLAALLGIVGVAAYAIRGTGSSLVAALLLVGAAMLFRIEMMVLGFAFIPAGALRLFPLRRRLGVARDGAGAGTPSWLLLGSGIAVVVAAASAAAFVLMSLPARWARFLDGIPERVLEASAKLPFLSRGMAALLVNTRREEGPDLPIEYLWVGFAAVVLALVAPFLVKKRLISASLLIGLAGTFALSLAVFLSDERYRSMHGLITVSPFAILAPGALVSAWREEDPVLLRWSLVSLSYLTLGLAALFIIYVRAPGELYTGLEWGQRYLLALYPLLCAAGIIALADYWKTIRPRPLGAAIVVLATALVLMGVNFQTRGYQMLGANLHTFAAWDRALRTDGPVLTDIWWMPTALADLFATHDMHRIGPRNHVGEWATEATARGVRRFSYIGFAPIHDSDFGTAARYRVGPYRSFREMTIVSFQIRPSAPALPTKGLESP